jgi:hypothetical protein
MASTSLVRTQLKYLPVAVQRKTKKETKRRNEAEENQPEQRRSEKYKQRRHNTIQDPSSSIYRERRKTAASNDSTRDDDLLSLRHRIHPPQKPHHFLFFLFPVHRRPAGRPRRSRTREKGGILLGETSSDFLLPPVAFTLPGSSGFSESLCGGGVWTERRCRR